MISSLDAIAQLLALRVVDSLAWGTVIVLVTVILLRFLRQSASTRFALSFASLIAIAALPLISSAWRLRDATDVAGTASAAITLPDRWALYLCGAWMLIAGWFAINLATSLWHLHVIHRESDAIDPSTLPHLLRETLEQQCGHRAVALRISDRVHVPTAIGLLRPAILVPRWVMQELTTAELNQIFLHELAHLRRWDDWTNLVQQLVKVIFFFHPAVWWVENRITLEREMACDDAVLAATASPRAYAECLAHLAEKSFAHRTLALAQAALGRLRQISLRVAQILDTNRPPTNTNAWKPAVAVVGAVAIACGVWSSRTPRLIAFEDDTREDARSSSEDSSTVVTHRLSLNHLASDKESLPASVTYAKLTANSLAQAAVEKSNVVLNSCPRKAQLGLVQRASVKTAAAVPLTETFFVVIEDGPSPSPNLHVYQIQVFRVTILRQSIDPAGSQIPQKEI